MNNKKSCKAANDRGWKTSDKKKLGADARIIAALRIRQPQKAEDIYKSAGIDRSSFYKSRYLLTDVGLIKETAKGYVLWYYSEGSLWGKLRESYTMAGVNLEKIPIQQATYSGRDAETGWRLFEYSKKGVVEGTVVAKNAPRFVEVARSLGILVNGEYDGLILTSGVISWKDRFLWNSGLYEVEDVEERLENDYSVGYKIGELRMLIDGKEISSLQAPFKGPANAQHQVRTYLTTHLKEDNIKKDNCSERAPFCVMYSDPDYSLPKEFVASVDPVDGVYAVGASISKPLISGDQSVYSYEEHVPIFIYTIDKVGVTSARLESKMEAELRRVCETLPIERERLGHLESHSRDQKRIGNRVLHVAEFVYEYTRSAKN